MAAATPPPGGGTTPPPTARIPARRRCSPTRPRWRRSAAWHRPARRRPTRRRSSTAIRAAASRGAGAPPRAEARRDAKAQITAIVAGRRHAANSRTAITAPAPVARRRRRDRRHPGHRRSDPAAEPLRRPQHRAALHAQRRQLHAVEDRRQLPHRARHSRHAHRRRQRRRQHPVLVPVLRHRRRPPRSSTPTATSPSAKKTSRAPSATSRGMLTGPPRVAPFFADLDPTTGSGKHLRQRGGRISTPSPGATCAASTRRAR